MSLSPVDCKLPARRSARVKICGITSLADAQLVVDQGVDALGLVFYEPSPRCVTIERARQIASAVGPFVTVVGLFVNPRAEFVREVLAEVPLHLLQFHGDESEDFCRQFQRPYMKALRMRPELDLDAAIEAYPSAAGILLDAYRKGVPGGTGETFDWQRVPQQAPLPIVLAGGLCADNVAQAIAQTQPYGVDVSGGVESAPGCKGAIEVAAFMDQV